MVKKIAFLYAHGGPAFDTSSSDGLNERGRNLVLSIRSAISRGADKVFVGEAVYSGKESQVQQLLGRGLFSGVERFIDLEIYLIAPNVKFPKNYLMNRGAQRAVGFFGLVFSDSDVLFTEGFPKRIATELDQYDFLQPEYIMYLDPQGHDQGYLESTMKRAHVVEDIFRSNISYLEGMPGMVNIAKREKFLEIGGFSQAISGVNYEDIEYQIRLKLLQQKSSFMHDEWVRHLHHSRSAVTRNAENLPGMFFENSNFLNWWVDHYIQIRGTSYNHEHFQAYMRIIIESLHSNMMLGGPYRLETGTLFPDFNPTIRYTGHAFGAAEPYVESGTREEKIAAVVNAAQFWHLPYEEIIRVNPSKFLSLTANDILSSTQQVPAQPQRFVPIDQAVLDALEKVDRQPPGRRRQTIDDEILTLLGELGDEHTIDREILQILLEI